MNSLLQLSFFSSIEDELNELSNAIGNAKMIQLMAPADLDGILALAQLEASFLDNSLHYRRRVLPSRRHVGRDHVEKLPDVDGLIVHIDPFSESRKSFEISDNVIHIRPIEVELSLPATSNGHRALFSHSGSFR